MQITLIHKENRVGRNLIANLEKEWPELSYRSFNIDEVKYYSISASNFNGDFVYKMNGLQAVLNSSDRDIMKEVLDINGIPVADLNENINRSYDVLIYEMAIISIRQRLFGSSSRQSKYIQEDQIKKYAEMARRAIYLMGLNYGMVKIVVNTRRKAMVMAVSSSPLIRDKDFKVLLQKINIMCSKQMTVKEVKMGADPEFMISNSKSGKMIAASQFFPREGLVGCDNIRVPSRQQRPVAEIRPKPDHSPLQLLNNIKQALSQAEKLTPYRNIKWLAGSQPFAGYSIGGHIHFSNVDFNSLILRALDNYVGLPVFLIENSDTAVKRRKRYGFLADIRLKDYGGFEYRTPGSWLVSEKIACAVLCLAKIVASNYGELNRNYFMDIEAQKAFYEGNKDFFKDCFQDLWSDIIELSIYERYRKELEIISEMIVGGLSWDEKGDLRKAWNIKSPANKNKNYNNSKGSSSNRRPSSSANNNRRNSRSTSMNPRSSTSSIQRSSFSTSISGRISNSYMLNSSITTSHRGYSYHRQRL